jgi:hypothetical protein
MIIFGELLKNRGFILKTFFMDIGAFTIYVLNKCIFKEDLAEFGFITNFLFSRCPNIQDPLILDVITLCYLNFFKKHNDFSYKILDGSKKSDIQYTPYYNFQNKVIEVLKNTNSFSQTIHHYISFNLFDKNDPINFLDIDYENIRRKILLSGKINTPDEFFIYYNETKFIKQYNADNCKYLCGFCHNHILIAGDSFGVKCSSCLFHFHTNCQILHSCKALKASLTDEYIQNPQYNLHWFMNNFEYFDFDLLLVPEMQEKQLFVNDFKDILESKNLNFCTDYVLHDCFPPFSATLPEVLFHLNQDNMKIYLKYKEREKEMDYGNIMLDWDKDVGYFVRTNCDIPKNTLICEYLGKIYFFKKR